MMCSVNELESLVTKAARGAGAHPAQAVHFGRAAVFHIAAKRSTSDMIAALDALPDGIIQTRPVCAAGSTSLDLSYKEAMTPSQTRLALPARLLCPSDFYEFLQTLAGKTYVPASEESRTTGAGAGLTDND